MASNSLGVQVIFKIFKMVQLPQMLLMVDPSLWKENEACTQREEALKGLAVKASIAGLRDCSHSGFQ